MPIISARNNYDIWHIKGVLESGELDADSVVAFFATVRGFKTFYSTRNLR